MHLEQQGYLKPTSPGATSTSSSYGGKAREKQWALLAPPGHGGGEALRRAAAAGDVARCRILLESGASPHSVDEALERTPMHYAAQHNHAEVIALLHSCRADSDARDLSYFTPLHLAAERGAASAVHALLRLGADNMARTTNGSVALHLTAHNNHADAAQMIIDSMTEDGLFAAWRTESVAHERLRNNYGMSPVDHARDKGHVDMMRLIADGVADAVRRRKKATAVL